MISSTLLFFATGWAFVARAGIQTDEAMFAGPLFRSWQFYSIRISGREIPMMVMSYVGCLKTWLYAPFLGRISPSAAAIRLPAVILGALTVLIFGSLLKRLHSGRAAGIGALLLATDTSFVLATTYDWGPVALQHLLFVTVIYLGVVWFQSNRPLFLAEAAFCCGLGLWDKAVFASVLAGLFVGVMPFAMTIRRQLSWNVAVLTFAGFCAGCAPLIAYNVYSEPRWATFRSGPERGAGISDASRKFRILESVVDGSALFGFLVNESAAQPAAPQSIEENLSVAIHGRFGEHRNNLMVPAIISALLLSLLLCKNQRYTSLFFSAIATVVAWVSMVVAGGGGSTHHAILLWPLPHLFVAVAFSEASRRIPSGKWVLAGALSVLSGANLLLTNQYLYQLIRYGASDAWTEAIFKLADDLQRRHPSQVVSPDWGLQDSLTVLLRGQPAVRSVDDPFLAVGRSSPERANYETLSDPTVIWVQHAAGHEMFKGINARIRDGARKAGFEPVRLETYFDHSGRAIFETFRFRRIGSQNTRIFRTREGSAS
ncbi:MAG: hypothetical protein U0Q18_14980 [Bryobacteraceae bacterium]